MKRIIFFIGIIGITMMVNGFADQNIKDPNVAGQFYIADPQKLSAQIQSFLQKAPNPEMGIAADIIVAPHAGYVYSGRIAACAFKQVMNRDINTVVVLAPSHHFGFPGISIWSKGGYKTPLGVLKVDEDFALAFLAKDALFIDEPAAFEREHSLEVELPFIQEVFGDGVKIVPVVMGQASFETCRKVATSLNELIGKRDDVLVVVSSDMSHFHNDKTARAMDGATLKLIESFDAKDFWQQCAVRKLEMCGFVPVTTAMLLAQQKGLKVKVLRYENSGDTTGDKGNVVGYGAVMFYRKKSGADPASKMPQNGVASLTLDQERRLMEIAKDTVKLYVTKKKTLEVTESDPRLNAIEGAFVTLHKNGRLRGCIGHIIGQQPLYLTVRDMAVAAASQDPRFNPVDPSEIDSLDIEISVLSKPWIAKDPAEIEMGVHGVIVKQGRRQGVFLPQVATETGWDRETFLSQLCATKAGLPADAWKDPGTELHIFTATVFSEEDLK